MSIDRSSSRGFAGLFDNLRRLADRLDDLAEGGTFEHTVQFGDASSDVEGVAGIRIRTGSGRGESVRPSADPEASPPRPEADGGTAGEEEVAEEDPRVRRPVADVQWAGDAAMIRADMPGVAARDVRVAVDDRRRCILTAAANGRRYRVEVDLPREVRSEDARVRADRGIIQVLLPTASAPPADDSSTATDDERPDRASPDA